MDLGLDGRAYIVTGGSRGLGLAAAGQLLDGGARVVVAARDPGRLAEAADLLAGAVPAGDAAASAEGPEGARSTGPADPSARAERILPIEADLADPETADRLVASAHARFGRLDGAVVSVGGPPATRTVDATDEQWRAGFETVFLGSVRLAVAVARGAGFEGASIVLVLSTSVREPIPGLGVSNGLRPGLAMVAKELADELGPVGVRVNAVLPGRFDTDRVRELDEATGDPEAAREAHALRIPLRRYGQPEELGRVAAFLASPAASYVTGAALNVDGGLSRST